MKVSVIVPTYNRAHQLPSLFESLENQTFKDFELIVLNDGSTDNTVDALNQLKAQLDINFILINSKNIGRAKIRNLGVKYANGDLLIFFDDDVRVNKRAIELHMKFHGESDKPILVAGQCRYDFDKCNHRFIQFRSKLENAGISNDLLVLSENLRINGANFSILKSSFNKIGGFDHRLGDKEDFKLSFEASTDYQMKVYLSPSTWVYHDDFRSLPDYIARAQESRWEEQKLQVLDHRIKSFDPARFNIELPNKFRFKLAKTIFGKKRLIILLDKILAWKIIPKRMAFKIYDIIITVNVQYLK